MYPIRKDDGQPFQDIDEVYDIFHEPYTENVPLKESDKTAYKPSIRIGKPKNWDAAYITFGVNRKLYTSFSDCDTIREANQLLAAVNLSLFSRLKDRYGFIDAANLSLQRLTGYDITADDFGKIAQRMKNKPANQNYGSARQVSHETTQKTRPLPALSSDLLPYIQDQPVSDKSDDFSL